MAAGGAFGFLMGRAMIPFLRLDRHVRHAPDRPAFEKRLKVAMLELGYKPEVVDDDIVQFTASNGGSWTAGPLKSMSGEALTRVTVVFEGNDARLVGPRWTMRKLLTRI